ncbi:spore coat protein GerQ [Saccharibacillus sp. CPCC 101409]|uniref:spore coat protein GerQ n=1 Tax=Saccharibacillus sp. CPCC 101409 TaxID=3058041 RepID=UPI002672C1EF|nr:spore coat protein GerQ [Saccharibacillus sp. CPCC 101409]MDO3412260.1 spore coat protein GerQ [Saccharibacillus sp. CPCC 101409]
MMEYAYSPVTYRIGSGLNGLSGKSAAGFRNPLARSGAPMIDASIPQTNYDQPNVMSTLQNNLGRIGTFYLVPGMNAGVTASSIEGRLEAAGSDHIVLSAEYGQRTVVPMSSIDYVVFSDTTGYFYSGNEAFFAGQ